MSDPTDPTEPAGADPGGGASPPPGAQPPGGQAPPGQGAPPPGSGPPPGLAVPPGSTPLGWVNTPIGPRWRGPVGRARPIGVTILLTIVTCGVWAIVWSYQNHDELQRYRGDGLGGAVAIILAIFVSPAIMFTVPMEIEKMYQEEGQESPVTTLWGLWFLLPIIGNIIWYVKVQDALNDFWVARGAEPA